MFDCELQIYFNKSDGQVVQKYNAKLALSALMHKYLKTSVLPSDLDDFKIYTLRC